jgi:hypothetical protein
MWDPVSDIHKLFRMNILHKITLPQRKGALRPVWRSAFSSELATIYVIDGQQSLD